MESRKSKGRSRKEKFAYPWAMAPMINMRKPVATAIATFVSTDKFIIFPAIIAAIPITPVFGFYFLYVASNFGALMDARRRRRKKRPKD